MSDVKKVCVVVASRANYGRVKSCLRALKDSKNIDLSIIVSASALLSKYGEAVKVIEKDGFSVSKKLQYLIEGESLSTQSKSTGLGIIELTSAFDEIKPDCVVTVADRFETMATAISASYLNIPLLHIQGGEVSGNIDDKVRHSISKLSDYHFCCTELSKKRLLKMAEPEDRVFNIGCPAMDILKQNDLSISNNVMSNYTGVGAKTDWEKPYILVIFHPVTTSFGSGGVQMKVLLNSLKVFTEYQKIVLWPNVDAGSDDVSKSMRVFREENPNELFHYYKNFSPEDFARVLANCKMTVGNSSSFIREGEFLGIPSLMLSDRQSGREVGDNVVYCNIDSEEIISSIRKQLNYSEKKMRTNFQSIYGDGTAGMRFLKIVEALNFTLKGNLNL